ncbi:MAG TPA: hypothetical protein VGJ93_03370, partial [Desulfuromonadaceae bacterium]
MQNQLPIITHSCDASQTPVIPPFDPGVTPVTPPQTHLIPTQTGVIPPSQTALSRKQALVFHYLVQNISRQTSYGAIGTACGISKPAARAAVSRLAAKQYISGIGTVHGGDFQGFVYRIINIYPLTPPPQTVCPLSDSSHTHSSSYNLESKLTTKTVDLNEPELLWWSDLGLTDKQILSWLDQFKMYPEYLAQALRFARFDIVENKIKPNGEPISKP